MSGQTVTGSGFQDFGSVAVGSANTENIQYEFNTSVPALQVTLRYGRDFSGGTVSCSGTNPVTCSIAVTFTPQHPGLRQDAVLVMNGPTLLFTTLLRGVGLGPQMLLRPALITTYAGEAATWGYAGNGMAATSAWMADPEGVAVDMLGNLYIADTVNQVIREVSASTHLITTIAGTAFTSGLSGDGGPATSATLNTPIGLAVDGAGNLFIADSGNNRIRRVDSVSGLISTVAGGGPTASGNDGFGDGGLAISAQLSSPTDVAVDAAGNLYVADSLHNLVRRVDHSSGLITVVAGSGSGGGTDGLGDGNVATLAILSNPTSLALDAGGNLYISDEGANVERVVSATTNIITAVVGNGGWGYYGDGGAALTAGLAGPWGVRLDAAGNIYLCDFGNSVLREVDAKTGLISTLAGMGSTGYGGDGGNSAAAFFYNPTGLAIDSSGNIFVADGGNDIVRRISPTPSLIDFGTTYVGLASPVQTFQLTNTGNQNLSLISANMSTGFLQFASGASDCHAAGNVAPGSSCTFALAFAPSDPGLIAGALSLQTNAGPITVPLKGTANGTNGNQVAVSATSLNFGNQSLQTTSAAQQVTVTNITGGTLVIKSMWVAGANASDFALNTSCGSGVPAGNSCSISILFTPSATGTRIGTLYLSDGTPASPQAFSLTGNGMIPGVFSAGTLILAQGQSIALGPLVLVMQSDGNLVLYQSGIALWSSQTYGQNCGVSQCFASFQSDGNFVVYNGSTPLWSTSTWGNPGARLVLSAQSPQIEIIGTNQSILWTDNTVFSAGNLTLAQGASVSFGPETLVMQSDGNLVLYEGSSALWSSQTYGQNCGVSQCFASFQSDGNFVVYNGSTPLWSTSTWGNPGARLVLSAQSPQIEIIGTNQSILWTDNTVFSAGNLTLAQGASVSFGPETLVMQSDGNLVLYEGSSALWSSQTYGQNCGVSQCFASFQSDGNFVVYNGSTPLWSTSTWGNPGARLVLSTQSPHLEIINRYQSVLWSTVF